MSIDVVRCGGDRLRIGPWRGDADVAYVAPSVDARPATAQGVRQCLDVLAGRGYRSAVTSALAPPEAQGFLLAGFAVRERLHLLIHSLDDIPAPARQPVLRRVRRSDRDFALGVDERAFPPFWRLDASGLAEAVAATPSTRFRVTAPPIVGYAVTGRAGRRGYLQRLAVDPERQREGIGAALALDGLRWLRRWGAQQAMVNTQESNTGALALYERLGFRLQPSGLAVLEVALA
jgi:GNAT superfamily N-acetyltransferase